MFGGAFTVLVAGIALTQVVVYKPYGVPDSQREGYDEIIAEINLKNELLRNLDASKRPVARVDRDVHDFGLLDPHTAMTHSFNVTNDGEDPLALKVASTSCKCTTGKLVAGLLQPGESTKVTLEWNTGYHYESYEQNAVLKTNDPLNREITLTVKGTVRTKLAMPEQFVFPSSDLAEVVSGKVRAPIAFKSPLLDAVEGLDIGTLNAGKLYEFPITVQVRGSQPEKLAVLGVEPSELIAEVLPTKREGHYRLLVTIPSDCPDVVFNRRDQHGFVQVGNPDKPDFMNWFPVYGAVVNIK